MLAPLAAMPALSDAIDAVAQRLDLRLRQPVGRPQRVDLGPEQRLVGVDVPDARDPLLVEQERLDRSARRPRQRVQVRGRELLVERLEAEPSGEERVERVTAERQLAGAEAPRVGVCEVVIVEPQPHAGVRRRSLGVEQQRAGHAQVLEQVGLAFELPHEVLAAPPQPFDRASFERGAQLGAGERTRPALVEDLELAQRPPLDVRRQMTADRLDLRELWHRLIIGRRARCPVRAGARG